MAPKNLYASHHFTGIHHIQTDTFRDIQELYFAEEATVLSGNFAISWDLLKRVHLALHNPRCLGRISAWHFLIDDVRLDEVASEPKKLLTLLSSDGSSKAFKELLTQTRTRQATLGKDFVYGLLGMLEESTHSRIAVHYSDSTLTGSVFAQAVRAACEKQGDSEACGGLMESYLTPPKREDLPSWCPDFSAEPSTDRCMPQTGRPGISYTVFEKYRSYGRMSYSADSKIAVVRGFTVDRVDKVTPNKREPGIQTAFKNMEGWDDANVEMDDEAFHALLGKEQDSWFSMMETLEGPDGPSRSTAYDWLEQFLKGAWNLENYEIARRISRLNALGSVDTAREARRAFGLKRKRLVRIAALMSRVMMFTGRAYAFRTVARRTGFSPSRVKAGDIICHVPDGRYLCAISEGGRTYVSSGVYVEGLVGDDLLKILPIEESEWMDFHLC